MPPDPDLYAKMAVPFVSKGEADAAVEAFFEELEELRKKHKITTLICALMSTYLNDGGEDMELLTACSYGDHAACEALAAYQLGYQSAERAARTADMLRRGKRLREKRGD
jgi:hypothetical protein